MKRDLPHAALYIRLRSYIQDGVIRAIFRLLAFLLLVGLAGGAARAATCPTDPPMPAFSLPHLRAAAVAGRQLVIVALGSSSTEGIAASVPARNYPAVLQDVLSDALPDLHVAVLNRGISGQDAPKELDRMAADVIAVRPQLVIWQVGANAALRHADPAAFHTKVLEGVRQAQAAGIDVVLMDNQRAPRVLATAAEDEAIGHALARAAREAGAGLFSRDRLMAAWEAEGAPAAEFIAPDGLHHNDRGYLCVARALARAIAGAARAPALVAGP